MKNLKQLIAALFIINSYHLFSQSNDYFRYKSNCTKDSINHLYYKHGKILNGIDTMKEVIPSFDKDAGIHGNRSLGFAYYSNGKLIQFIEKYYYGNEIGATIVKYPYDTETERIRDGIYDTWGMDSSLIAETEFEKGNDTGLFIGVNNGHILSMYSSCIQCIYDFYENGQVRQEEIGLSIRNKFPFKSMFREWYNTGVQKTESIESIDTTIYYDTLASGKIIKVITPKSAVADGKWQEWYDNGQINIFGFLDNGHRIGKWQSFYKSGKLQKVEIYDKHGKLLDTTIYDENGNLEK